MTQTSTARITAFLDCWHRFDLAGALTHVADGIVFTPDLTADPIVGREAVGAMWGMYMEKMRSYAVEVRGMAGDETRVFVERVERIGSSGGHELVLPIVGVFELDEDGRICAWRDYWDTAMAKTA